MSSEDDDKDDYEDIEKSLDKLRRKRLNGQM